jgi:hypothetical protein
MTDQQDTTTRINTILDWLGRRAGHRILTRLDTPYMPRTLDVGRVATITPLEPWTDEYLGRTVVRYQATNDQGWLFAPMIFVGPVTAIPSIGVLKIAAEIVSTVLIDLDEHGTRKVVKR